MNELPDEVIHMIFNYLPIGELIRNKLVCRRWYRLISERKFHELIVFDRDLGDKHIDRERAYWYHNYRPINLNNLIFLNSFNDQLYQFTRLRRLKFFTSCKFDIDQFNKFVYLEILEFKSHLQVSKNVHLNLSELKVLKLPSINFLDSKLIVNSSKLEALYFENSNIPCPIEITNPNTLKSLDFWSMHSIIDLKRFSNLEIVKIVMIHKFWPNANIFSKLPNSLKQLFLNLYAPLNTPNIESLLKSKDELNRPNLKMYFNHVYLDSNNIQKFNQVIEQDDYNFKWIRPLEMYMSGDYELEDYSSITYFNNHKFDYYNKITNSLDQYSAFFTKFKNLQSVELKGKLNDFINFISNCPNLVELCLENPELDQNCYDRLPNLCGLLRKFSLKEENKEINFEFIFKLKLLKIFHTSLHLSIERLVLPAFKRLRTLNDCVFQNRTITVSISRTKMNLFQFNQVFSSIRCHSVWYDLSLDELINLCNDLKVKNGLIKSKLYKNRIKICKS